MDSASFLQSQQMSDSMVMLKRLLHVPQFLEALSLDNRGLWLISPEIHRECHTP